MPYWIVEFTLPKLQFGKPAQAQCHFGSSFSSMICSDSGSGLILVDPTDLDTILCASREALYPDLALDIKSKTGCAPFELTGESTACSIGPLCMYQSQGQSDYKPAFAGDQTRCTRESLPK